jgi:hypothetical protein
LSDQQDRQQSHPLHADDRAVVDRLLASQTPADEDLVHLARLLMRYEGFPGADDLRDDLHRLLDRWQLDREELHRRSRALWAAGFRPGSLAVSGSVGSGFDTADQDTP